MSNHYIHQLVPFQLPQNYLQSKIYFENLQSYDGNPPITMFMRMKKTSRRIRLSICFIWFLILIPWIIFDTFSLSLLPSICFVIWHASFRKTKELNCRVLDGSFFVLDDNQDSILFHISKTQVQTMYEIESVIKKYLLYFVQGKAVFMVYTRYNKYGMLVKNEVVLYPCDSVKNFESQTLLKRFNFFTVPNNSKYISPR